MPLRVLAVLVVLVLPSFAGAVEGLVHLCQGSVQLDFTGCCDHEKKAPQPRADACTSDEHDDCCGELKAQQVPTPASTAPSGSAWTPPSLATLPPPVRSLPPAPETQLPEWVRIRGLHRATAPPLYIQHCSYLK